MTERKVCFITGSGSGNGRGMAIRFAELGYDIYLHHSGRNPELAEDTKREIEARGVTCKVLVEDLTESGGAQRLFEKFRAEYDRLDLFVNNSGLTIRGSLFEITEETVDTVINLNFRACYFCTAEAGKFMREKGTPGTIILIGSNHLVVNFKGRNSIYASMKAAMARFTKWAALEFSPYGIRVNCIAPGNIDPEYDKTPDFYEKVDRIKERIPLKRFVPSSELADFAEFLASPSGRSITGQTILVDGGDSLRNTDLEQYHLDQD